jgi:hypothetical protein
LYEALGNTQAADTIARATQWIGKLCESRGGRVVRFLGDGVLMAFSDNDAAVYAMIELQRLNDDRVNIWPENLRLQIKVGIARGPVIEQEGDCFGDAVNLAERLSELAGADQILVSRSVVAALSDQGDIRSLNLGMMDIRGKSEQVQVQRVEWQDQDSFESQTVAAYRPSMLSTSLQRLSTITLTWLDSAKTFEELDFPIYVGRENDAHFTVNDPRVSRMHLRIDRRGKHFALEDLSSYGTWVRFLGSDNSIIALRRQECILVGHGEISLGASFTDLSAPCLKFSIQASVES